MAPQAPKYRATGLDLTAEECSALVAYVRSLPQPVERRPSADAEAKQLDSGRANFAAVGCANCHSPNLGNVQGIFSDLLLHDMGQEMGDEGSYGEDSDDDDEPLVPRIIPNMAANGPAPSVASPPLGAPTRQEWRTPPLWGFRDSGPYLHDGRAQTLEQAVAMHGGQGAGAANRFFKLTPRERLAGPGVPQVAGRAVRCPSRPRRRLSPEVETEHSASTGPTSQDTARCSLLHPPRLTVLAEHSSTNRLTGGGLEGCDLTSRQDGCVALDDATATDIGAADPAGPRRTGSGR